MLFSSSDLTRYLSVRKRLRDVAVISRRIISESFDPTTLESREELDSLLSFTSGVLATALTEPDEPEYEQRIHLEEVTPQLLEMICLMATPSACHTSFSALNFLLPAPAEPPPPSATDALYTLTLTQTSPNTFTFSKPPYTGTFHLKPVPIITLSLSPTTPPIILPGTPDALESLIHVIRGLQIAASQLPTPQ